MFTNCALQSLFTLKDFTFTPRSNSKFNILIYYAFVMGRVVQLVAALRYKIGGLRFDSRQGPWKFSSDVIIPSAFSSSGVHSACNRNEYQGTSLLGLEGDQRVKLNNSTVQFVPNVRVRTEFCSSILFRVSMACYGKAVYII